jgi:hypothetical protein
MTKVPPATVSVALFDKQRVVITGDDYLGKEADFKATLVQMRRWSAMLVAP